MLSWSYLIIYERKEGNQTTSTKQLGSTVVFAVTSSRSYTVLSLINKITSDAYGPTVMSKLGNVGSETWYVLQT